MGTFLPRRAACDILALFTFSPGMLQVLVLYVDEETSIKRQLQRAKLASLHNKRVKDAGAGQF
jgi:hypothetical protein